ncbi:MAG: uracil-DNA glycosylase, partial [Vicingaceae bacterium]
MNINDIPKDWQVLLKNEFEKDYFKKLATYVDEEYNKTTCYPPKTQLFEAFKLCPYEKLKVVILGQDPYHGEGQAHGLCFSVNEGIDFPPSLKNIFREIHEDLGNLIPKNGDLSHWAKQGVLLLNATLSV